MYVIDFKEVVLNDLEVYLLDGVVHQYIRL